MKKVDTTSIQKDPATDLVDAPNTPRQPTASLPERTLAQCLAPELLAQWTSVELEALSDEAVDSLSEEQVAALCTAGIEGLSQDERDTSSSAAQEELSAALVTTGLQSRAAQVVQHEVLSHWGLDEWEALTPAQFALLTPTQVASLNCADVQALSDEVIDSLSAEQVTALSTAGIRGLSSAELDALSGKAIDSPAQAQALQADEKAKMSTAQMAAIGTVALAALGSACLAAWRVSEVPSLNSTQLSATTKTAVGSAMQIWGKSPSPQGQRKLANAPAGQVEGHHSHWHALQPAWSQTRGLASKGANGMPARASA